MTRATQGQARGAETSSTHTSVQGGSEEAGYVSPGLLAAALSGLMCLSACGSDDDDDAAKITLSRVDTSITEESFREACEELHGTVEVHPSCGGVNSCRGMSYDLDTHVYTEHTCKGLNTCRGFSCVLPESA
jgi:hypothetical protein